MIKTLCTSMMVISTTLMSHSVNVSAQESPPTNGEFNLELYRNNGTFIDVFSCYLIRLWRTSRFKNYRFSSLQQPLNRQLLKRFIFSGKRGWRSVDFPLKIKRLVFHTVCVSKELKYRVRWKKWLQKAWAMSAILHNFHYNVPGVFFTEEYYNANYVKIALGKFLCIRFFSWRSSLHFSCNVLQERWRIKTYIVVASGTKQKTEDFEER